MPKKITEFKPLQGNPNAHTERGYEMLERSISDVGYTAPMVASSDGVILDGNARYEKSGALLGDDVIVVESDGTKPIVHIRTDITADSEQARKIVYLANRVAEVDLQWDAAQLLADLDAGVDLRGLWTDAELEALLQQVPDFQPVDLSDQPRLDEKSPVTCPHCGASFVPQS